MLYTQEDNTLVEEIRKMGKGNRVWVEILKFLAVSVSANLIMVFVGEIIKKVFLQEALISEDISMLIQLYESVLACCTRKNFLRLPHRTKFPSNTCAEGWVRGLAKPLHGFLLYQRTKKRQFLHHRFYAYIL